MDSFRGLDPSEVTITYSWGHILPLSRTYVIKTQHNNNAMLIPNLTR